VDRPPEFRQSLPRRGRKTCGALRSIQQAFDQYSELISSGDAEVSQHASTFSLNDETRYLVDAEPACFVTVGDQVAYFEPNFIRQARELLQ
jgi:hypothetical protein